MECRRSGADVSVHMPRTWRGGRPHRPRRRWCVDAYSRGGGQQVDGSNARTVNRSAPRGSGGVFAIPGSMLASPGISVVPQRTTGAAGRGAVRCWSPCGDGSSRSRVRSRGRCLGAGGRDGNGCAGLAWTAKTPGAADVHWPPSASRSLPHSTSTDTPRTPARPFLMTPPPAQRSVAEAMGRPSDAPTPDMAWTTGGRSWPARARSARRLSAPVPPPATPTGCCASRDSPRGTRTRTSGTRHRASAGTTPSTGRSRSSDR